MKGYNHIFRKTESDLFSREGRTALIALKTHAKIISTRTRFFCRGRRCCLLARLNRAARESPVARAYSRTQPGSTSRRGLARNGARGAGTTVEDVAAPAIIAEPDATLIGALLRQGGHERRNGAPGLQTELRENLVERVAFGPPVQASGKSRFFCKTRHDWGRPDIAGPAVGSTEWRMTRSGHEPAKF
jgi:hypothetical protein